MSLFDRQSRVPGGNPNSKILMPIARSDWPRLLNLVEQALDLPVRERALWLQSLDLPTAVKDALGSLLKQRDAIETGDFLARLPKVVDPRLDLQGSLAAGTVVGPWRLLRPVGQGGMSVVWLAERADGQVTRQVAVKLPHAGPGQDSLAQRLMRERNILAALEHPNIARLYDVGLTDAGTPYLAMEYVEGDTLLAHADSKSMTIAQRLMLFQQALAAIRYAHGKLVLHRDLKPGNILVGPADEVKLLDFGVARILSAHDEAGGPDLTDLTGSTGRPLTPGYASPEQLQGKILGTASDIYSLGVILYEMLCGQRPHTVPGQTAAQLEAEVLHGALRPPSRLPLSPDALAARSTSALVLSRQLRGDLDAIVLKSLAVSPEKRYDSVDSFASDLANWQAGRPVTVHAPGAGYYLAKFVHRHRLGVALGTAAMLGLATAVGIAIAGAWAASQQAARAATARDFLLDLFAEAAPDRLGGVALTAIELLEQGRQKAQARLGNQPRLQAELLAGIGETQFQIKNLASADAALGRAADLFNALGDTTRESFARLSRLDVALNRKIADGIATRVRDLQPLLPMIEGNRHMHLLWQRLLGQQAIHERDYTVARDRLVRCIEAANVQDPNEAEISFQAHGYLAIALAYLGDGPASEATLAAAGGLPNNGKPLAKAMRDADQAAHRAEAELLQGRYVFVRRWLPEKVTECESNFGRNSLRCGELKNRLLWTLLRIGESREALARVPQVTHMLTQHASTDRFMSAYLLARILAANGQTDRQLEPMAALEQLAQVDTQDPLPTEFRLAALYSLIEIRLRAGDRDQAEEWLQLAEVAAESVKGQMQFELRRLGMARGLVQQSRGRHLEALQSMGFYCEVAQHDAVGSLASLNCIDSLVALGQKERAVEIARAALNIVTRSLGPEAPNTSRVRRVLEELGMPGHAPAPSWDGARIFMS